jgi:biotin transport system substrate-specific component
MILTRSQTVLKDFALVTLTSLGIGLLGHVSIPLWFTPVPIVTQNTAALLAGGLLGARRGFLAVAMFLMQGALGLPVFSKAGSLLGPTGGYLVGYAVGAYLVGKLIEKKAHPLLALGAGHVVIYALGVMQLSHFVGWNHVWALGVAPFLFGCLLKTLFVCPLLKKA